MVYQYLEPGLIIVQVRGEEGHTAGRIGICVVQLEGDTFDEMGDIVRAAYDIRVGSRSSGADCDGPFVGVI